ncbi:transmembrane protein 222 isoform X1 [Molossus molossus]|uniref:transmembrane protein 222 isoform X1 n=1 Tax=Molossus molossus TaxID=27622 RepID=UPI0017468282|nr:transmembrane protein 222 isoform X1 [Molossus molossus]XP_036112899.1 transmembrane protein 222 isoform X1 [Molossus molossus]
MAEVEAPTAAETDKKHFSGCSGGIMDVERSRFPYCVVWTPIPVLTWLFPIIGHMGICTSTGVIRDFAGPYFVSEDNMAFGKPAKYWKLDPARVYASGPNAWDTAVHDASEEYKHRMHNLCCDNCHSHVALALNLMRYNNSTNWNMVTLCFFCLLYGKYVRGPHYESCGQTLLLAFMPRQVPGPLTEGLSPETGDCGRSQ